VSIRGSAISTIGPGQFIGEMAMLRNQPRSATVTATSPMTVLVVGIEKFRAFMRHPGVARAMASDLADRLARADGVG